MTNTKMLEGKILESGKKKSHLAKVCGLSRQGFHNCLLNKAEFNAEHIKTLCIELNITKLTDKERIFFA